jgi:prepilin-type N-terminal cleavage/methylation domain-containing protein
VTFYDHKQKCFLELKKMENFNSKGFTLIELLVVIAIIGILSTIAMTSLTGAKKKANDAAFKSAVTGMLPAVALCCNSGGNLNAAVGGDVCDISGLGTVIPAGVGAIDGTPACNGGDYTISFVAPSGGNCDTTPVNCTPNGCKFSDASCS